ncbi:MAG: hypothetical protein K0S12_2530 [Bacteroidetes bacterium]|nr:hypothetical protein [Bacteroidota bacterium]
MRKPGLDHLQSKYARDAETKLNLTFLPRIGGVRNEIIIYQS